MWCYRRRRCTQYGRADLCRALVASRGATLAPSGLQVVLESTCRSTSRAAELRPALEARRSDAPLPDDQSRQLSSFCRKDVHGVKLHDLPDTGRRATSAAFTAPVVI